LINTPNLGMEIKLNLEIWVCNMPTPPPLGAVVAASAQAAGEAAIWGN
jgi:hypothetical protein